MLGHHENQPKRAIESFIAINYPHPDFFQGQAQPPCMKLSWALTPYELKPSSFHNVMTTNTSNNTIKQLAARLAACNKFWLLATDPSINTPRLSNINNYN